MYAMPQIKKTITYAAITALGIATIALVARWYPVKILAAAAIGKMANIVTLDKMYAGMNYVGKATLTTITGQLTTAAAVAVWAHFSNR